MQTVYYSHLIDGDMGVTKGNLLKVTKLVKDGIQSQAIHLKIPEVNIGIPLSSLRKIKVW